MSHGIYCPCKRHGPINCGKKLRFTSEERNPLGWCEDCRKEHLPLWPKTIDSREDSSYNVGHEGNEGEPADGKT